MRTLIAFLLAVTLGYLIVGSGNMVNAAPAPRPEQPHTDQFQQAGYGNLALLNPVNQKGLLSAHTVTYRLLTMPGCTAGSIPNDMQRVEAEAQNKLHFSLVRNDASYDFTVRINCGSEQIRICGAVNIFCLGRGFPYNDDVEMSDILSTYQSDTQLAVPLHEIVGHALATFNEQYCLGTESTGICRGLALFTPAPGWVDVMNTGPNSRHGLDAIELERWSRTMYNVLGGSSAGFDPFTGRWFQENGWSWEPASGNWFNPAGVAEFSQCDQNSLRWDFLIRRWTVPGASFFDPASNYWATSPGC